MATYLGTWPSQSESSTRSFEPKAAKATMERYFIGPKDISRHSKWPHALQMHGSVTPKLIIPVFCVTCWAVLIVAVSQKLHPLVLNPVGLMIIGLVVALALNLRGQTSYERYYEGRRMWSGLGAVSTNLARHIWLHAKERDGALGKEDLVHKLSAMNLIIAFSVALKHRLRFEPYTHYDDLYELVNHLNTFAGSAGEPVTAKVSKGTCKRAGEMLRVPMAKSNPRKELKRAERPLGNLPLEILSYISVYLTEVFNDGTFTLGIAQNQALNCMNDLHTILATMDRILNTPMPIAYRIAISQITWIYLLTLPFQLVGLTGWLAIPITTITSYVILALLYIGNEIENPFGPYVSDLPLELYCAQIASDVSLISSISQTKMSEQFKNPKTSKPLYPSSSAPGEYWTSCSEEQIYESLRTRATASKKALWERQNSCSSDNSLDERDKEGYSPTAESFQEAIGKSPQEHSVWAGPTAAQSIVEMKPISVV